MKREVKANIENDEKKKKKSNGKKLVSITMAVIMLLSISITPFGAVMADNETATVPDNETILTTPDNETTPIPSPTPSPANETASSVNETTSTPPPENETVSEPFNETEGSSASFAGDYKPPVKVSQPKTISEQSPKQIISYSTPQNWSKSQVVAVVDDYYSSEMGSIYPSDYPNQTFYEVSPSSISASTLANYDTVFLFAFKPANLNASQKTDLVTWLYNGGKLIIWDGEEACYQGPFDYTWLPYPFQTSAPGAMGASGYPLWIVEENALSSADPTSPYYIDTSALSNATDAVGDANVFTSYSPDWYVDMEAQNVLGTIGPVHLYVPYGHGIVMFCGLDWDYAGYAGSGWSAAAGCQLKKILKQELDCDPSGLGFNVTWPGAPSFNVTKVSDKPSYLVGDSIKFTITAENTGNATSYGTVLTDFIPSEITTTENTTFDLGDMAPNDTRIVTINATAIAIGTAVENVVNVAGHDSAGNIVAGSGSVIFSITPKPHVILKECRTYTTDADFDEGILAGVEHETVHDQLQLSKNVTTLPFIWVPNNDGTVSKVQTVTGKELGRYRVAPPSLPSGGNPSRTTVDLQGNCWVGNRQAGTVVKIGLYEAGQWIDRNGDGICQTSQDLNGDGDITGSEILPWGEDECVLYEVVLIPGNEGTYAPGNYTGPYDTDYWGVAPRGLAIDAKNNLWGNYSACLHDALRWA
jgi:uncharacterized repeat protein (TIGR01451 family)